MCREIHSGEKKNECFTTAAAVAAATAAAAARPRFSFHHLMGRKPPVLRHQPPFTPSLFPLRRCQSTIIVGHIFPPPRSDQHQFFTGQKKKK